MVDGAALESADLWLRCRLLGADALAWREPAGPPGEEPPRRAPPQAALRALAAFATAGPRRCDSAYSPSEATQARATASNSARSASPKRPRSGLSMSSTPSSAPSPQQRHHDLGIAGAVAGDVAGKRVHVRHHHGLAPRRGGAAHPPPRAGCARRPACPGTARAPVPPPLQEIEPRPVDARPRAGRSRRRHWRRWRPDRSRRRTDRRGRSAGRRRRGASFPPRRPGRSPPGDPPPAFARCPPPWRDTPPPAPPPPRVSRAPPPCAPPAAVPPPAGRDDG